MTILKTLLAAAFAALAGAAGAATLNITVTGTVTASSPFGSGAVPNSANAALGLDVGAPILLSATVNTDALAFAATGSTSASYSGVVTAFSGTVDGLALTWDATNPIQRGGFGYTEAAAFDRVGVSARLTGTLGGFSAQTAQFGFDDFGLLLLDGLGLTLDPMTEAGFAEADRTYIAIDVLNPDYNVAGAATSRYQQLTVWGRIDGYTAVSPDISPVPLPAAAWLLLAALGGLAAMRRRGLQPPYAGAIHSR
jgi:hypothetical protein